MHYVRIHGTKTDFDQWTFASPKLSALLQCFDINRKSQNPRSPSVFVAHNAEEELEAVAAIFQKDPGKPERRFLIRIKDADCRAAGVAVDPTPGETGIILVDRRHVDLRGSASQYIELIRQIVAAIWRGEDRLRIVTAHQILGQIAIFSTLREQLIKQEASPCLGWRTGG
jgi:hypothetical protein